VQIRHREWDLGEPKLAPIVHQSRPIAKGEDGIGQEGHLPPLTRNADSPSKLISSQRAASASRIAPPSGRRIRGREPPSPAAREGPP
jgi:hypothetical protein